jgi:oleate hydratase
VPHQAAKAVLDDLRKETCVPQNCIQLATVDFAIRHRRSSKSNPLTKLSVYGSLTGRPANFSDHIEESKWLSFTTTFHNPTFFQLVRDLTGNVPGEGGLITFPESGWLASIVLPYQPHFIGQPADVQVLWGYGLSVDKPGNFVTKPMSACTGREIMTEVIGHLQIGVHADKILETCTCIPCMLPFTTSQFLRRAKGDRPQVVPEHSKNLAFVGQFCEQPEDVVFTVEYSIRSAQTAVYSLLGLSLAPPPVYKGRYDPRVLSKAFLTLHDIHAHA